MTADGTSIRQPLIKSRQHGGCWASIALSPPTKHCNRQKNKRPVAETGRLQFLPRLSGGLCESSSDMELRSFHQTFKCHALFGGCGDGPLRIEHAITLDLPDGRPTLPIDDSESLWVLIASLPDGRRQWRRVAILGAAS